MTIFRIVRHITNFKFIVLAVCCIFLQQQVFAQKLNREQVLSSYIYNFAKNIIWQEEDRISEFHFLIISDDHDLNLEMKNMSKSQTINGKPIRVTISGSVIIPEDAHLIFITRGLNDLTEPVFRRIEGKNMLLVSEGVDDKRFIMINFYETKEKTIKFEINKANIINQQLKMLPEMVLLGGTEIDVAKLYKESQDTLRIKEERLSFLEQLFDSLNVQIKNSRKEISGQQSLIKRQNTDIQQQQIRIKNQQTELERLLASVKAQHDTLSSQSELLQFSQKQLQQQQKEIDQGKVILSNQKSTIDSQNAAIIIQNKVLYKQGSTIESQKNVLYLLITIVLLTFGLLFTIIRAYKNKQRSEMKIKKLNADLQNRAHVLETVNKELESFAYSVSHDLRAPLRSIDGFCQIIIDDYENKLDEKGKDYLIRVRNAAQNMGHLIDDILNLSRVGRYKMNIKKVDLSKLVGEIASDYRESDPKRSVDFLIQKGVKAYGDERLLKIVFDNLLGNAWKFTSKHQKARIEFGMDTYNDKNIYFIGDDGAGFNMKYKDRLFGVFQRLHTNDEFPGTGIGLATVQRVIVRHGGTVWAEGAVQKGATFYFSLPNKREEEIK